MQNDKVQERIKASDQYEILCCRIREMEGRMERVSSWLAEQKCENDTVEEDVRLLEEYYQSGLWLNDFEADERGELPADLPRGVLSEDGLYIVLEEYEERRKEKE